MTLLAVFDRYRADLLAELKLAVGEDSSPIYNMMRYHLGWVDKEGHPEQAPGGKFLRPTLCLLACEAVSNDWSPALPAAAAIELVHNFTLIHDDIEDNSRERHHRTTVWKVWGGAHGINSGDGMWAVAQLALFKLQQRGVASEKIIYASHLLAETCLKLCEGQSLDIDYQDRTNIGIEDYLRMIDGKTAQLFKCSLALGALVGTNEDYMSNTSIISHFSSFGRNLGLAFQMHDDVLGIWSKEKYTGKSCTDIKEKKKSLPIVYAFQKAEGHDRERLLNIYEGNSSSANDVTDVLHILDNLDARKYTEHYREHYMHQALQELHTMNLIPERKAEIEEVATFMLRGT